MNNKRANRELSKAILRHNAGGVPLENAAVGEDGLLAKSMGYGAPTPPELQGQTTYPLQIVSTKDLENLTTSLVSEEEAAVIKKFYDTFGKSSEQDKESDEHDFLNHINSLDEFHKNAWIQTYSGRKFYPLNPYIDSIVIQDIAHALSMQCRFTGHCKMFYSVAQHCVLVSYLCDKPYQLQGLLHDGSEFALTDISSPIKKTHVFEEYRKAEKHLQTLIYKRFGAPEEEHSSVKEADLRMLATEARDLLFPIHSEWKTKYPPLPFKIEPLIPSEAEKLFLDRFSELFYNKCA